MRNLFIVLSSIIVLASCKINQLTIEVSNPSDVDHDKTTVEVAWADITAKLKSVDPAKIMVVNAKNGEELMHQVIYNGQPTPQILIFQVSLHPKQSMKLLLKEGLSKQQTVKAYGRFVPDRKDDYAWENDRVAFRMYGPALAAENPSNGVDIWMKRTEAMIVNEFYENDRNRKSYHVDHGHGMDCYKVGHTLGAGGIAPYVDDTLWVGDHFATQKTLDNGPLRITFMLTYDNWPVGKKIYTEEIVISLDAGSQLNKAIVSYGGDFSDIQVAAGISIHEDPGNIKTDDSAGYIAFGEIATSDAGIPAGRNYVAAVIPDGKMTKSLKQQEHILALAPYKKGEKFTYYFGGGWSQWGFDSDNAWFDYVAGYALKLKNPLVLSIK